MVVKNVNFKISDVKWDEFVSLCRDNDSTASEQIRNFINSYIKTYIDRN